MSKVSVAVISSILSSVTTVAVALIQKPADRPASPDGGKTWEIRGTITGLADPAGLDLFLVPADRAIHTDDGVFSFERTLPQNYSIVVRSPSKGIATMLTLFPDEVRGRRQFGEALLEYSRVERGGRP